MANKIFIIADTHFGHKRICEFEPAARPFASVEEMNTEMVRRWNAVVKPSDTVWHLGDVLFGAQYFSLLRQLNGIKNLVMGNHDRYPMAHYVEHFSHVCGAAEINNCLMTHIPAHPSQFSRYKANLHGHLHSKALDDPRYINVSCEQSNLAPQLLADVLLRVPPNTFSTAPNL